jgi:hypothetical protein
MIIYFFLAHKKRVHFKLSIFIPFRVFIQCMDNPREQGRCICGTMEQAPLLVVDYSTMGKPTMGFAGIGLRRTSFVIRNF